MRVKIFFTIFKPLLIFFLGGDDDDDTVHDRSQRVNPMVQIFTGDRPYCFALVPTKHNKNITAVNKRF